MNVAFLLYFLSSYFLGRVVLQQVQQMRWITSAVIISADLLQCCCSLLQSAAGIHHSSSAAKAADASNHYTASVMEKCSQWAHIYILQTILIFKQTMHTWQKICMFLFLQLQLQDTGPRWWNGTLQYPIVNFVLLSHLVSWRGIDFGEEWYFYLFIPEKLQSLSQEQRK